MEKITAREFYTTVLNSDATDEMKAFATKELEKIDHRNQYAKEHKGVSKKALANAELANAIVEAMEPGKAYTVGEVIKTVAPAKDLSSQKVSAILNGAVADTGAIVRTVEKRKAYFSRA